MSTCTRPITQPTVLLIEKGKKGAKDITQDGFVEFEQGKKYDLFLAMKLYLY